MTAGNQGLIAWKMCVPLCIALISLHCGSPLAPGGGNDVAPFDGSTFQDDEEGGVGVQSSEYLPVYSFMGESTQVVYTESFMAVVSIGSAMHVSQVSSESFDINNGLDLTAPWAEAAEGD